MKLLWSADSCGTEERAFGLLCVVSRAGPDADESLLGHFNKGSCREESKREKEENSLLNQSI